jgi:hypothetical protein
VQPHLLAVITDFKLECVAIELGCQFPANMRRYDTVNMFS